MPEQNETGYPEEKDIDDSLVDSFKVGASLIPILGAPVIELMNMLVTPVLQERRDAWFKKLGERVKKLEEEGRVTYEELQNDNTFIDISIKATEIALKTHQEEKLEALRNALINSTLNNPSIDISLKQIFLNYIDIFTIWHIKLLKLFNNPKKYEEGFQYETTWHKTVIEHAFPELRGKEKFYITICKDLYLKDLITLDSLTVTMTKQGLFERRISQLGLDFLLFIEEK